jgi:dihydropteroate synthase
VTPAITPSRLTRARTVFSRNLKLRDGRTLVFPLVMGVLNVTPDSFSDGGQFLDPERALEHALAMEKAGAGIIDVGGESTRPVGAQTVSVQDELSRITPVFELLERKLKVPVSIDTRKAAVAEVALRHGAALINDISALSTDPAMGPLARQTGCVVILMHMRGGPENHACLTRYRDVVGEVRAYLRGRARYAEQRGINPRRIIVDPGLGFAKTAHHNLQLLSSLYRLCALGYPVMIGASRKRFVRQIAGEEPRQLLAGNTAVNVLAIAGGASIVRVHDVVEALAAVKMVMAVLRGKTDRTKLTI